MSHRIVVLGAGLAGIPIAHHLLKRTPSSIDITVTLVAPNEEAYWNFAVVRGILPDMFSDDQLFLPLIPAFKKYARQLEHIIGRAESLDPDARTVTISTASGDQRSIPYDTLVIATGSSFKEAMPFKHLATIQETKDELHKFQNKIRTAKSVVVAGAGTTGVEVVAELGQEYGRTGAKEITFISHDELPLSSEAKKSVRETIASELEKNKVRIVKNTRVVDTSPEDAKGPRTLHLRSKDGKTSTMVADVVIKTYGVIPNSGFVPPKMLDDTKRIRTTPSLQAEGYESIFVVGDVASTESPSGVHTDGQVIALATALQARLAGKPIIPYAPSATPAWAVSLGRNRGTGQAGNFRIWSFVIWYMKSKNLGTDKFHDYIAGKRTVSKSDW